MFLKLIENYLENFIENFIIFSQIFLKIKKIFYCHPFKSAPPLRGRGGFDWLNEGANQNERANKNVLSNAKYFSM